MRSRAECRPHDSDPHARPTAAVQLVGKAGPPRRGLFQAQRGQTQLRLSAISRKVLSASRWLQQPVHRILPPPVQVARPGQLGQVAALPSRSVGSRRQVHSSSLRRKRRLWMGCQRLISCASSRERAHLAGRLDPFQTADLLRQAHLLGQPVVGRKVRQHALVAVCWPCRCTAARALAVNRYTP